MEQHCLLALKQGNHFSVAERDRTPSASILKIAASLFLKGCDWGQICQHAFACCILLNSHMHDVHFCLTDGTTAIHPCFQ
jgi:hypothetical protein